MIKNIVLIGAGNLATQIGINMVKKGLNIRQVYSYNIENAEILANSLNAYATNNLEEIQKGADLYIIAVKDDVLLSVIEQLPTQEGIVVHTAGSLSMDMLIKFNKYGIIYPFQTFSKDREVDFNNIPILIEANDEQVKQTLEQFSGVISKTVISCDSEQRRKIHLAAVFACNFTNHMYSIANQLLQESNISFEVMKPLILETAHKMEDLTPRDAQTGPAVRGDKNIMSKHLKMLDNNRELADLYKLVSSEIQKEAD